MILSTKPDFDQVRARWNAFWDRQVIDRPLVWATAAKPGSRKADLGRHYRWILTGELDALLEQVDIQIEGTEYLADSIPYFQPDLGPDQFAAFLGAELEYSDSSPTTNWVKPVIEDWEAAMPLRFDPNGKYWRMILDVSRRMARHGEGRYLVGMADLHSNADALSALRGPQRFCMDFYDHPDMVAEAMRQVRRFYQPVYEGLFEAGNMGVRGSIGWLPFWCAGRFATVQCDCLALMGPEMGRKYVLPALEEEASFLDHCVYHLDGPPCLPHLDDILSIKDIDVIQWGPGAGQPPVPEWMDVLRRIQKAGKILMLYDIHDLETLKRLARELRPEGAFYWLGMPDRGETLRAVEWLQKNT